MPKGLKGFQKGHPSFLTEESRRKIGLASKGNTHGFKKGQIPWSKGKKFRCSDPIGRSRKISEALKKQHPSESSNLKRSKTLMGHFVSNEQVEKQRVSLKKRYDNGLLPWMKGKKHTFEARQKMSLSAMKRDNGFWFRGYFHSSKNNKDIPYRSSYELKRFEQLENNDAVDKYEYEKIKIKYIDSLGNERITVVDLVVHYKDGSLALEEVKSQWMINQNYSHTIEKLNAVDNYAQRNNMVFRVLTERELDIKLK
jgi:hypothetical protein